MTDNRYLFMENRLQQTMKRRLHEATIRKGLHIYTPVAVTFETLVDVKRQLEAYLDAQLKPAADTLN